MKKFQDRTNILLPVVRDYTLWMRTSPLLSHTLDFNLVAYESAIASSIWSRIPCTTFCRLTEGWIHLDFIWNSDIMKCAQEQKVCVQEEPTISIHDWLQMQRDQQAQRAESESAAQRLKRKQREAAEQDQPIPGLMGPWVFEWEEVAPCRWIRIQIRNDDPHSLKHIWQRTTSRMRVYNSARHEYDICYICLQKTQESKHRRSRTFKQSEVLEVCH